MGVVSISCIVRQVKGFMMYTATPLYTESKHSLHSRTLIKLFHQIDVI